MFRTPAYPVVPVLGGVASLALTAFMGALSTVLGAAVLTAAAAWYVTYARDVPIAEGEREEVAAVSPLMEAQVLVPVRGEPNADRIARFVTAVADEVGAGVLLLHAAVPDADREAREQVVATFRERFAAHGLPDDRLDWEVVDAEDPEDTISERSESYHLIVLGETDPGDPDVVLGRLPRNVASRTRRPVIVVRSAGEGEDERRGTG